MFYAIKMLLLRSKSFDPVYACILIPKMLWESMMILEGNSYFLTQFGP